MDRLSQDPYSILGLPPDANKSQIRRAYQRRASPPKRRQIGPRKSIGSETT